MERTIGIRVSPEFHGAVYKSKWLLQKDVSVIVREAIVEYLERHLNPKDLKEIRKMLDQAPETTKQE